MIIDLISIVNDAISHNKHV